MVISAVTAGECAGAGGCRRAAPGAHPRRAPLSRPQLRVASNQDGGPPARSNKPPAGPLRTEAAVMVPVRIRRRKRIASRHVAGGSACRGFSCRWAQSPRFPPGAQGCISDAIGAASCPPRCAAASSSRGWRRLPRRGRLLTARRHGVEDGPSLAIAPGPLSPSATWRSTRAPNMISRSPCSTVSAASRGR